MFDSHAAPPQWETSMNNTTLNSMESMDGLEDLIMSDAPLPLTDDMNMNLDMNMTMADMMTDPTAAQNHPRLHHVRVVSKGAAEVEQQPPLKPQEEPQQQQQQHPEDFSFDKFFANYNLPPHLQTPHAAAADDATISSNNNHHKPKRSHRRAHTVSSYMGDNFYDNHNLLPVVVAPPAPVQAPAPPPVVHVVSSAFSLTTPAPPVTPSMIPVPVEAPVAAPAPSTTADQAPYQDPILAFLTSNNHQDEQPPTTFNDSHPARPAAPKRGGGGRHRRVMSESSAAFGHVGNPSDLFFPEAGGITNVMMELASDTPTPTTTNACHDNHRSRSSSEAGLCIPPTLPEQTAVTVDHRQFMNHGTEANWLENLR